VFGNDVTGSIRPSSLAYVSYPPQCTCLNRMASTEPGLQGVLARAAIRGGIPSRVWRAVPSRWSQLS